MWINYEYKLDKLDNLDNRTNHEYFMGALRTII